MREPHLRPQRQPARRRGRALAGLVAVLVVGGGAVTAFSLHHQHSGRPGRSHVTVTTSPPPVADASTPTDVVQAYFAAINAQDYARAWQLLNNPGGTYQQFEAGFAGTAHDYLKILAAVGDKVSIRLTATQTDGTVKQYRGTYTVMNGLITHEAVGQTG